MRIISTPEDLALVQNLIESLKKNKITLGFAESCTGGLLSSLITEHPGVSEVYMGSVVSYSNAAKINILGVRNETLQNFGAVSAEVAQEMSEGLLQIMQVNCAVSITGVAGPTGATEKKPLGMVCFGFTHNFSSDGLNPVKASTFAKTEHFSGNRQSIQMQASLFALRTLQDLISSKVKR
ncbi:MAG: CinA family protein [Pseudobdellovibrionaceae bacterium]